MSVLSMIGIAFKIIQVHFAFERQCENVFIARDIEQLADGIHQDRTASTKPKMFIDLSPYFGRQLPVNVVRDLAGDMAATDGSAHHCLAHKQHHL